MSDLWDKIPKSMQATIQNNSVLKWVTTILREYERRFKDIDTAILNLRLQQGPMPPEVRAAMAPQRVGDEKPVQTTPDMTAEDAWENM